MIKIAKTVNSTITITDSDEKVTFIILGKDCEVRVIDEKNMYDPTVKKRKLFINNKYNAKIVAAVTVETLDPASDNYSSDMDTYASNLRASVLYV